MSIYQQKNLYKKAWLWIRCYASKRVKLINHAPEIKRQKEQRVNAYNMQAKVVVVEQDEFKKWYNQLPVLGKQVAEEKAAAQAEADKLAAAQAEAERIAAKVEKTIVEIYIYRHKKNSVRNI